MNEYAWNKLRDYSLAKLLRKGPGHAKRLLVRRWYRGYYWRHLHGSLAKRIARRRDAAERLEGCAELLVLCHGNRCRSPFAERYASDEIERRGIDLTVRSGGLREKVRRSPPNAREAATAHGIDLDRRSRPARRAAIERADPILLMDYRNFRNFTKRYPDAADRMFLLGVFAEDEPVRIEDPYGRGVETFAEVYDRIVESLDALLDEYEARNDSGLEQTAGPGLP